MKKMNSAYRLQLIKEVALKNRLSQGCDPMASHISGILKEEKQSADWQNSHYQGAHYDESVGGWVSDFWDATK